MATQKKQPKQQFDFLPITNSYHFTSNRGGKGRNRKCYLNNQEPAKIKLHFLHCFLWVLFFEVLKGGNKNPFVNWLYPSYIFLETISIPEKTSKEGWLSLGPGFEEQRLWWIRLEDMDRGDLREREWREEGGTAIGECCRTLHNGVPKTLSAIVPRNFPCQKIKLK